jgi:hypothetical protein
VHNNADQPGRIRTQLDKLRGNKENSIPENVFQVDPKNVRLG